MEFLEALEGESPSQRGDIIEFRSSTPQPQSLEKTRFDVALALPLEPE